MKALSIKQPWAWLICAGYKDIENRNRPTSFTGRIYVHAPKLWDAVFPEEIFEIMKEAGQIDHIPLFRDWWAREWTKTDGIVSQIIGEVDITGILRRIKYEFEYVTSMGDKQRELEWLQKNKPAYFSPWFTDECGLTLANPILYDKPIPCRGKLGFFEPDINKEGN